MTITITCKCGTNLRTKDDNAGKQAKCPACGCVLFASPLVRNEPPKTPNATRANSIPQPEASIKIDSTAEPSHAPRRGRGNWISAGIIIAGLLLIAALVLFLNKDGDEPSSEITNRQAVIAAGNDQDDGSDPNPRNDETVNPEIEKHLKVEREFLTILKPLADGKNTAKLEGIADQFTRKYPDHHLVLLHATLAYLKSGNFKKVINVGQSCVQLLEQGEIRQELRPSHSQLGLLWSCLGSACIETREYKAALGHFQKAARYAAKYENHASALQQYLDNLRPTLESLKVAVDITDRPDLLSPHTKAPKNQTSSKKEKRKEDPRVTKRVEKWFQLIHLRTIPQNRRSELTPKFRRQLTSDVIRKVSANLRRLGAPQTYHFVEIEKHGNTNVHTYEAHYERGKFLVDIAITPDDKIDHLSYRAIPVPSSAQRIIEKLEIGPVTIELDGVLSLAGEAEEIRGKIKRITEDQSVILEWRASDDAKPKLLLFPPGTVQYIFCGTESECLRNSEIREAGFDLSSCLHEQTVYYLGFCSYSRDGKWLGKATGPSFRPSFFAYKTGFTGCQMQVAYDAAGPAGDSSDWPSPIEIAKLWKKLDAQGKVFKGAYTWTRQWAASIRASKLADDWEITAVEKAAPFINLPDNPPYRRLTDTEKQMYNTVESIVLAFGIPAKAILDVKSGKQEDLLAATIENWMKLSPKARTQALHGAARTIRAVRWVARQGHQENSEPPSTPSTTVAEQRFSSRGKVTISGLVIYRSTGKPVPRNTKITVGYDDADPVLELLPEKCYTDGFGRFSVSCLADKSIKIRVSEKIVWTGKSDSDKNLAIRVR